LSAGAQRKQTATAGLEVVGLFPQTNEGQ